MFKKILLSKKKIFKYLLIGSNGLLGSQLKELLPKKHSFFVARNNSDYNINLINLKKLEKLFEKYKFLNVINVAAITDLQVCQKKKNLCRKINYFLPLKLNFLSKKYNFKLTQISTDQVYISNHKKKNNEKDKIGYKNYYAKTKYLTEKILSKNSKSLIIRTNFTGFKDKRKLTFISWIDQNIKKEKKINLFNNLICSTIDVLTCAKIIIKLLNKSKCGVFNLGTGDSLSKKNYAILYAKKLKKKIYYNDMSATKTILKRTLNLRLNVKKIEKALGIKMITSSQSINNLIRQKKIHEYNRN
jgi:dTDP-4-dehydrorhamnose reductase